MELTQGTLLGGRVSYTQPASGFRNGIEPVLLAASVPARPGMRVLEAGTGAGAALLCLTARVGGLACTGVERDPAIAALARANVAANAAPIEVLTADITHVADSGFDHGIANPPWHPGSSTTSPNPLREDAKRSRGDLAAWIVALSGAVRPGGSVTLILPAALVTEGLAALRAAGCGGRVVAPLWPKPGRPAKIVVLSATRGSRAADRVAPGLVLHQPCGAYTEAAEAILRHAAAWPLDQPTSSG